MKNRKKQIRQFFNAYSERFNLSLTDAKVDAQRTADSFADYFIEASPVGIMAGKNDSKFKQSIIKGNAYYKKIGTKWMKIISNKITLLDDDHAMAKIHWLSSYEKRDGNSVEIAFDVCYFLQNLKDGLKIFAYITGDEQKALKENDII